MTLHVVAALGALRAVAERADPTLPVSVGELAAHLGAPLSRISRLCGELASAGLLLRAEPYGSYAVGPAAIRLSGRAAAPFATAVRYALILAAQQTGETVCLSAPTPDGLRVISAVDSGWTLYAAAEVGELVSGGASETVVEVASPVDGLTGEPVAVVAVRMPAIRSRQGAARAHGVVTTARRSIERSLAEWRSAPRPDPVAATRTAPASAPAERPSSLDAAVALLEHLAAAPDTAEGIARARGLRLDRTLRIVGSCVDAGLVRHDVDRDEYQIAWAVHGWHRAATTSLILDRGTRRVIETADATGACAFVTVMRGMRSVTLVEQLRDVGDGVRMNPWLGRPAPITLSDGGPSLIADFPVDEIGRLFPTSAGTLEVAQLLDRVGRVADAGVVSTESIEEAGLISISAPIRDASGAVAAAACLVGPRSFMRARLPELEAAAVRLAADVSEVLEFSR